ncbi:MAG TPA: phosphomannomutase/phosphoglucomutase [Solirubrobacterales bacterium]|jgi:phosphomannomutase|nr:phosphomannomutase/phosphoglucomutase [Solirubrobacterales bacterium]
MAITSPPASIFKAYDIRGIYGEEMDGETAFLIGRAFARVLGDRRGKSTDSLGVGLGRDMRLTSPEMGGRFAEGLMEEGCHVMDAGEIATEVIYYLVGSRSLDGGAMITASHNPKPYTGVKLVREGALPLSGDAGIGDVRDMVENGLPEKGPGGGTIEVVDVVREFQEGALAMIRGGASVKPMRVVVDGGNGMAGPTVGPLLRHLKLDLVELYFEPDGNFPDHEPNPLLEENRKLITETVVNEGAALGIAWDGDADRCFFIDSEGTFVDGDFLTALLAESLLTKKGGGDILYDVRASRAVPDTVRAAGGTSEMNRVGHAFFKARMRETGAIFGGEVSGHYYFHDFFNADSGTIPALLVLELLSEKETTMVELMKGFRSKYFISGEINSEVTDQEGKMEEIAEQYSDGEITRLDGLSLDYPDWHFNVRPSNTEPLLRLNLESLISPEHMAEKRDEVLALIRA